MVKELVDAFVEMREDDVISIVDSVLQNDGDVNLILDDCRKALCIIGKRFENGDAFLPELMMAGDMMGKISSVIKPKLNRKQQSSYKGKVLLGTVKGDIHDVGKDIVSFMLDINGFEVIDLGVDVSKETFIEKIREAKPDIVGMSGLLTLAFDSMKETIEAIEDAGLRKNIKIMIGGAPVDEMVRKYCGADAFGTDAVVAVNIANKLIGGD